MARIERLNSLRDTAARWFERAGRDATSAETHGPLQAWLAESAEHAAAFRSIERTWIALKSAAQDPAILGLRQEAVRRLTPRPSASHRPLRWAAAALIILSVGAALWIVVPRAGLGSSLLAWFESASHKPGTQSYATKTGDRLTIALDDGSKATLNTATQLDVTFSKQSRTVRLLAGEALFEVAKDASRPFVVQTENRRFIAVGTAFDVHIETNQVKVTMLEGTVRAESIEPGSPIRTTVTAGEQLIARANTEDHVRRVDPQLETSWRTGQVIFDNTPLRDAIDELNRYSTAHIELADPQLADLRLSGTFATERTTDFVEAIAAYFPIQIERTDAKTVRLKARPRP
jgi:transmembrane sensor